MQRNVRRFYSTSSGPTASEVAEHFLIANRIPRKPRTQYIDSNQALLLASTLNRPGIFKDKIGQQSLPPCWHLAYFTPPQAEATLGADGTDASYNPTAPFTRRMWAGGELSWTSEKGEDGKKNSLRLGQIAKETTRVVNAEAKRTKAGEDMVVVGVEKTFENKFGPVVVDRRNWIFRPEITVPKAPEPTPALQDFPEGEYTRDFCQTPVSLFRFSALTFNGHKIHYNREWCREVEGHRDLVVHGPLNLIHMVDFWRDIYGKDLRKEAKFLVPKNVKYRATNPLYVGEKYRVIMEKEVDMISEVRIVDSYGIVSMTCKIERDVE